MIPHEYRKHFPIEMKDHNSHDVLLLCTSCHAISNYYDIHLKQQLAREFQAPIGSEEGLRLLEDPERRQVRSGARALLNAESLPAHRKEELLQGLREFYRTDRVTEEMLQEAASLETRYDLRSCSEGSEDWSRVFTPAAWFECLYGRSRYPAAALDSPH